MFQPRNAQFTCCYMYFAQMVTMLHCQCSVCKECFQYHYSMKAKKNNIADFNCLVCCQPDLADTNIDMVEDYLLPFAVLLKEHLSYKDYQLFQKKATEFSLLKDPTFRWCAHVSFMLLVLLSKLQISGGFHIHLE